MRNRANKNTKSLVTESLHWENVPGTLFFVRLCADEYFEELDPSVAVLYLVPFPTVPLMYLSISKWKAQKVIKSVFSFELTDYVNENHI